MYQIGDLIIYGSHGVCRVENIGSSDIAGAEKDSIYYTLCPLYQNGRIFTPIDTKVFMRPVITYTEVQELISIIPSVQEQTWDSKNLKLLEEFYQESIQTYDCLNLIKVIKTIYAKKLILQSQGKKLGKIDENFMKKAEDLLYGEFAVVLRIPRENVRGYIEDKVKR